MDLLLQNKGDDAARHGLLRIVVFSKDVGLTCSAPFRGVFEELESATHTILVPFGILRPGVIIPFALTANYPTGIGPFTILFNVDADEIPAATLVGGLNITPPLPKPN